MILSASVNADIPAHYGAWFMRRLDAGFCRVASADSLQARRLPLTRETVDGFVFWTRCVGPFLAHLAEIRGRGFAFTVQYAITGYPQRLETAGIDAGQAIVQLHELARKFGPHIAVWRYDPLLVTSRTPLEWHVENFERLARSAAGATSEAVIAFARFRRKPRRAADGKLARIDPEPEEKRALVKRLAQIARGYDMRLTVCAQPDCLAPGAAPARCIDARRIAEVAGRPIDAETAGFLAGCLCARAADLGDRSGDPDCFCGAVPRRGVSLAHDPNSEFLFLATQHFARAGGEDLPF